MKRRSKYMVIQDTMMARLLESDVEPSSAELARYVIGRLGLDRRDNGRVEQLAFMMILRGCAKDPEFVTAWRERIAGFNVGWIHRRRRDQPTAACKRPRRSIL
jgi:hypothetical protein